VLFAPVAALSSRTAAWAWSAANLIVAMIAGGLAARAVRPSASARATLLLILTFLCWSGTRTLLQFTLIALALGVLAWRLAARRPWIAGVCLGLATMKPQVAIAYAAWAVATRRWRVIMGAGLTIAALWTAYCVRAGAGLSHVVVDYVRMLHAMYTGPAAQVGVSELVRLLPARWADVGTACVAAVALGGIVAALATARGPSVVWLPGLVAAGMLVTFRHLSYAFVSLLPAAAYLLLDGNAGAWRRRRWRFWGLQAGLIVDAPTVDRLARRYGGSTGWLDPVLVHFDRGFLAACFVGLVITIWASRAGSPARTRAVD
jgi:hypothetical protein